MKDQVKRFIDDLKARPELAEKFGKLETQEEREDFLKPYLDGLSYNEFCGELAGSLRDGGADGIAELDADSLDDVAGGAFLGDFFSSAVKKVGGAAAKAGIVSQGTVDKYADKAQNLGDSAQNSLMDAGRQFFN
jgi:hypothetical protein